MFDSARSVALALCLIVSASIVVGCAERTNHSPLPTISDEAKASLKARINCSNARADIAILEEERASVGKRILSGVRSVLPFAAVAGILMGDYRDRVEVATGQYNADIEQKISEIKQACF